MWVHGSNPAGAPPVMLVQSIPLKTCISPKSPQFVHQTVRPAGGVAIEFLFALVMRGGNKPFDVEAMSKTEELFGMGVPIPTCAVTVLIKNKKQKLILL